MSDLTDRLRAGCWVGSASCSELLTEAADRIDELTALCRRFVPMMPGGVVRPAKSAYELAAKFWMEQQDGT